MIAYNFSKLKNRDKRVYSISDITVSKHGVNVKLVIIAAILVFVSLLVAVLFGLISGIWYINPLTPEGLDFTGLLFTIGTPIGIACALYFMKIQQYRVIDFLIVYFKPKRTIDLNGRQVVRNKITFDAFLEVQD